MSMNPRTTTEHIKNDYQEYLESILSVKDDEITSLAKKTIQDTSFVKGPFLETTLPFVEGHSLKYLAEEEGLISKEFSVMGKSVHYDDWKLRIHQEDSLRKIITEKRNMVVSTGTGSGKTECYLYPIFNELMREKENGTLDSGVRALLIFPMNALANDQQKKLRKLLKDYPDITFGRYTGETEHKRKKETVDEAERRLHQQYDDEHVLDSDPAQRKSIQNELMCREKMAETPPHILLTNYAMLEFMLLRPDTAPFFDNESAKNWRFLVIDEAHTYQGAGGTEIALLLRRVKERIRHHMKDSFRCIATSATLGDEKAKGSLAEFAQNLFDEPFEEKDVITTQRINRDKPSDVRLFMPEDYKDLKKKVSGLEEFDKGTILYNELEKDERLFKLYEVLKSKPKRIEEVASIVFDDIENGAEQEAALIDLIELSAAARKSEYDAALLPARYHLFVKSLEGMFIQFYPRKSVYLDRKEKVYEAGKYYSVFELANCQKCGQEYLIGKNTESERGTYFTQTSNTPKPDYYFIPSKEETEFDSFDEDDEIEETEKMGGLNKYHLCLACGKISPYSEKKNYNCCSVNDNKKVVTVYNLNYSGKDGESNCCPCCGATRKGLIKRFLTANQPATFAVAKSLYDAIPPRPIKPIQTDTVSPDDIFDDDIFADDIWEDEVKEKTELPSELLDESGRKLLIFSDNRQEAAFFAGFFEKKYTLLMWRKLILKVLKESNELSIDDLIGRVMNAADKAGLYTMDQENLSAMTDDQKRNMAAHYVMQEFLQPDIQTGLEGLGYIEFSPIPQMFKDDFSFVGLQGSEVWNLLRFMMDTLRQKGAVNYPEGIRATDDFFAPRNHYGYFRQQESSVERGGGYIYGFMPADKAANRRLSMMKKVCFDSEKSEDENTKEARKKLLDVFALMRKLTQRGYIVESTDSSNGVVYCLNYAKWNAKYISQNATLFRCNKCGKLFNYSVRNICPEMRCDGELSAVKAMNLQKIPYYSNLFDDDKLIPMVAKEHTAQLASKTAGIYQKNFEDGKINVLSCSTTFEMGVDVGELEATFQRNVPPATSNYIQRAGRAGRRTSSAAFSVTFARRSSHDMTFYQEPANIIAGKIVAPILEVDNEKMAERHLNSIIVAWFFKRFPEFFDGRAKRIVACEDEGYENMAVILKEALENHPSDLLESIHNALPKKVCEDLKVDEWKFIDDIVGEEGTLTKAIIERKADIEGLRTYSESVSEESASDVRRKKLGKALAAEKLITTIEEEDAITFLSAKGVLPKYGFPIDTVSLNIISGEREEAKKIDLSRDLKLAISEFAPPAQVVANGKVWSSYAINTIPDKSWPTYIYYECPNCKKIYPPEAGMVDVTFNLDEAPKKVCQCDTLMNPKKFIIPIFGFSTLMGDKPRPVGDTRPSTYYGTQTQFWGVETLTEKQKAEAQEKTVEFHGKPVTITYSPGGRLFVLNQGRNNGAGIRVCPTCGFATEPGKILKGNAHRTKYNNPCSTKSLVNVSLGHQFSTDILKIVLPKHAILLENSDNTIVKSQSLSILYALLEGASTALDISRDDINGCVTGDGELILYDDTAGGSGFVKHIYSNFDKVLKAAKHKVSGLCECTEETSCYGCLRNYSNQFYHDVLSRGLAYHYIDWLLNDEFEIVEDVEEAVGEMKVIDDSIGSKLSHYDCPDTSIFVDSVTQLEQNYSMAEDSEIKEAYARLIDEAKGKRLENPIVYDKIDVEVSIWPDIFWGRSHVALFTKANIRQYEILKKYDWHCYLLDADINAKKIIENIEGK